MSVKISIIIVTYKSEKYIPECLQSIHVNNDLKKEELEIIIVDNSSEDDHQKLLKVISDFKELPVKIIHNYKNGGYGQGNNLGIKEAKGKIINIMNPDVLLTKPLFLDVVNKFKDENLALLGGKQKGGRDISFYIRQEFDFFIFTMPLTLLLNKINVYREKYMFLSGAYLFIDKHKFEEIGLFDENFFMYNEESDVTRRFLQKKYKTEYASNLIYRHLIDDRPHDEKAISKELIKSNVYYFKKFNLNINKYFWQKQKSYLFLSYFCKIMGKREKEKNFLKIYEIYKKVE